MASPTTTISLMNGYVLLQQYNAGSLALDSSRGKFGIVAQVNSLSEPLAVDDLVIYRPDHEIRFKESDTYYSAVPLTDIVFVFTELV